ncbi:MAG TPA: hypothetical protein VHA82_20270 [Ramlibacter sp.]|uniref:beta strand repeat-containing protein n=1 Tax=Ramlibacter sp. TaxID=1917967 RepID=UPI002CD06CA9|nr:hypothetical protein [Ramlibacter sp.]HVZ46154.1 hypothetical protein [Ramlibacter sp.]
MLGSTLAYQTLHPNFEQPDEFAYKLLSEVGLQDNETVISIIESLVPVQTKATITYLLFNALLNVPANAPQAYLDAQATLLNKGEVAEYYSVTIGGRATDYATLNDIIAHVDSTDASVIAAEQAIDQMVATGPELTPGVDNLHIQGTTPTVIDGVVDGAADGDTSNATFNAGDRIDGNGHTYLDLLVVENGNAGFERLTNVSLVNVIAGTDASATLDGHAGVTLNAGGWSGVGLVSLDAGVDDEIVFVDHLKALTDIEVKDVKGTMSASYQTDHGDLFAAIANGDEGGDGIRLHTTSGAGVDIVGADKVSAHISHDNSGFTLDGGISLAMGGESYFRADFRDGTLDVASIDATMGGTSHFEFHASQAQGDVHVGNVDVHLGDDGFASLSFGEDTSDVTVGDVAVQVGDDSYAGLDVRYLDGDASAGAVAMEAGDDSTVTVMFSYIDGDLAAGNVDVMAGDNANVAVQANSIDGDIAMHDIGVVAGTDASIGIGLFYRFGVEDIAGALAVGNVDVQALTGSRVGLTVYNFTQEHAGDIAIGIDGGSGSIDVAFSHALGEITIGNVDLQGGEASPVEFGVTNAYDDDHAEGRTSIGNLTALGEDVNAWVGTSGGGSGNAEIGNVDLTAKTGYATLNVYGHAENTIGNIAMVAATSADLHIHADGRPVYSYETTSGTVTIEAVLGTIHVGNIEMAITGAAPSTDGLTADIANRDFNVGDIVAGNIALTNDADNSYVRLDIANSASATTTESNTGTSAGSITVGDIHLAGGSATALVTGAAPPPPAPPHSIVQVTGEHNVVYAFADIENVGRNGDAGDVLIGNVSIDIGDGFASGTETNEATVTFHAKDHGHLHAGDLTVGDVDVQGGDFVSISAAIGASEQADAGSTGLVTVRDVAMDAGESAHALLQVFNRDYGGGMNPDNDNGGVAVGDVNLAVAQDSWVEAMVTAWNQTNGGCTIGEVAVGDIHVEAGDNSTGIVLVQQLGHFASLTTITDKEDGDFAVGNVAVSVSATTTQDLAGGSSIHINITKTCDNLGSFDAGGMTVGDVMAFAAGADANVSIRIDDQGEADLLGDVSIGTVGIDAGDDAAALDATVFIVNFAAGGDIGNVTLGGGDFSVGDHSHLNATLVVTKDRIAGDVGNFDAGDFTLSAGKSSVLDVAAGVFSLTAHADVGDFAIGNVHVELGESSYLSMLSVGVVAASVGDLSAGDFTADLGENAGLTYSISVQALHGGVGDISMGDVNITMEGHDTSKTLQYFVEVGADQDIGNVTIGDWDIVAGTTAEMQLLALTVQAFHGDIGHMSAGDLSIEAGEFAFVGTNVSMSNGFAGIGVLASSGDVGGFTAGNVEITAEDGAFVTWEYFDTALAGSAGDMLIGDIHLFARDNGLKSTHTTTSATGTPTGTPTGTSTGTPTGTPTGSSAALVNTYSSDIGAAIHFRALLDGDAGDTLTIGDIVIDVEGTAPSDEVWVSIANNGAGNVVIGDIVVSGEGDFRLDGFSHTASDNVSFIAAHSTAGNVAVSIGNVDFSGYEQAVTLDLHWANTGAASVVATAFDDRIYDTHSDNAITGGEGADVIYLYSGGHDTIVTRQGDTGDNHSTSGADVDVVSGFDPGGVASGALAGSTYDLLDFGLVAGTAGNFVVGDGTYGPTPSIAQFIQDANDALNSTVRYFAESDGSGNTWVAVNYGSGEADAVILLMGVTATSLHYQNFVP